MVLYCIARVVLEASVRRLSFIAQNSAGLSRNAPYMVEICSRSYYQLILIGKQLKIANKQKLSNAMIEKTQVEFLINPMLMI